MSSNSRSEAQTWLDAYVAAWESYDPAAIADLFSEDCAYRYHPYDDPIVGRAAIVESWLAERDEPGSFEAHYAPYTVDGNRAVAVGMSRYLASGDTAERVYHNVFLLRFDDEGRCAEFTEWYILTPAD